LFIYTKISFVLHSNYIYLLIASIRLYVFNYNNFYFIFNNKKPIYLNLLRIFTKNFCSFQFFIIIYYFNKSLIIYFLSVTQIISLYLVQCMTKTTIIIILIIMLKILQWSSLKSNLIYVLYRICIRKNNNYTMYQEIKFIMYCIDLCGNTY
jgi:hypothetical protein